MSWLIFWLICAVIGVLALNYSMLKEKHTELKDLYSFAEQLNSQELIDQINEFKSFNWIVRPTGFIFSLILGPFMILILLVVYKKNFSIYYRPR